MGASSKNLENLSESKVALEMSSFTSGRNLAMSLTRPNKMSVCSVRSCASSTINTLKGGEVKGQGGMWMCVYLYLYPSRSGSPRNSLKSIPSVIYLRTVLSDVQSSNLMQ